MYAEQGVESVYALFNAGKRKHKGNPDKNVLLISKQIAMLGKRKRWKKRGRKASMRRRLEEED